MEWKEFYKLPLRKEPCGYKNYAWGSNDIMALMFDDDSEESYYDDVIDVINGKKEWTRGGNWEAVEENIFCDGKFVFSIRGWGELTSPACCGLSSKEACKVQDDFADYIISKFNQRCNCPNRKLFSTLSSIFKKG